MANIKFYFQSNGSGSESASSEWHKRLEEELSPSHRFGPAPPASNHRWSHRLSGLKSFFPPNAHVASSARGAAQDTFLPNTFQPSSPPPPDVVAGERVENCGGGGIYQEGSNPHIYMEVHDNTTQHHSMTSPRHHHHVTSSPRQPMAFSHHTLQPIHAPILEATRQMQGAPDGSSDRSWSSGYGSIASPRYDNVRGEARGPFVSYYRGPQPPPAADEILMVSSDCDNWAASRHPLENLSPVRGGRDKPRSPPVKMKDSQMI